MSKTNIYILQLESNKFYVGKSQDPEKRFIEHLCGDGSTWTKKYEPVQIVKVIPNANSFDEDRYVKEYMNKYGIDNVRGGSYVKEVLDDIDKYTLKKEIWSANDCCTQCGRKGHFVKDCFATKDVNGDEIYNYWVCDNCNKEFDDKTDCEKHEKFCKNKNSTPHNTYFQYTKKCEDIFNCRYCGKQFETQKGAIFHENIYCKSKNSTTKNVNSNKSTNNNCYRCGRSGHYASNCYASTNTKGYYLDYDSDSDSD